MGVLHVFRFRKPVPPEDVRATRKKFERAVAENKKASDEFHEAIADLLARMDKRKRRRHAQNR